MDKQTTSNILKENGPSNTPDRQNKISEGGEIFFVRSYCADWNNLYGKSGRPCHIMEAQLERQVKCGIIHQLCSISVFFLLLRENTQIVYLN